jgi:GDPmannose 4,6-dehydratase
VVAVLTALITGIAGQDGAYLSTLLRGKGYRVVGMMQADSGMRDDLEPYLHEVEMLTGDMRDAASLGAVVSQCDPDEIYNLAGISSVAQSWNEPELTADVNGMGVLRLLQVVKGHTDRTGRSPRLLQASSSEMFGAASSKKQNEGTPLRPRSPYALSKAFAHEAVATYREGHGMFASCAILFNHESPLRPTSFVTRKISSTVAAISSGRGDQLVLGDLDTRRDWGSAHDYVRAMWMALQTDEPRDYVVATGRTYSIRDWLAMAFGAVGIADWERFVSSDPTLMRPTEPGTLVGDASLAASELGWTPSVDFEELVTEMVRHDVELLSRSTTS